MPTTIEEPLHLGATPVEFSLYTDAEAHPVGVGNRVPVSAADLEATMSWRKT